MTSSTERESVFVCFRVHVRQFQEVLLLSERLLCTCVYVSVCMRVCYAGDVNSPCFRDNICGHEECGWVLYWFFNYWERSPLGKCARMIFFIKHTILPSANDEAPFLFLLWGKYLILLDILVWENTVALQKCFMLCPEWVLRYISSLITKGWESLVVYYYMLPNGFFCISTSLSSLLFWCV